MSRPYKVSDAVLVARATAALRRWVCDPYLVQCCLCSRTLAQGLSRAQALYRAQGRCGHCGGSCWPLPDLDAHLEAAA